MTDKVQLIKEEIERQIEEGKVKCQQSQENNDRESFVAWSEHVATCGKLLIFIDSLADYSGSEDRINGMPKNRINHNKIRKESSLEAIDAVVREVIPKDALTDLEFIEAKRIWESEKNVLAVVRYLHSVLYGESLKSAKVYFDLYIDDRKLR